MSWVKSSIEKPCENITCIMSEVFINLSLGKWGASNISRTVLNSGYFGYYIQWADHCRLQSVVAVKTDVTNPKVNDIIHSMW